MEVAEAPAFRLSRYFQRPELSGQGRVNQKIYRDYKALGRMRRSVTLNLLVTPRLLTPRLCDHHTEAVETTDFACLPARFRRDSQTLWPDGLSRHWSMFHTDAVGSLAVGHGKRQCRPIRQRHLIWHSDHVTSLPRGTSPRISASCGPQPVGSAGDGRHAKPRRANASRISPPVPSDACRSSRGTHCSGAALGETCPSHAQ